MLFEQGHQPGLGDAWSGQHHLPLRHLIDGVDVVDSLALGRVALMHGIDAQKAGLALGAGFAPFADLNRRGPGLFVVAQAVARTLAQVVEVAVGDPRQPLELGLAVDLELALEDVPRGRPAEPVVGLVDRGQQFHIGRGVTALETRPKRGLGRDPSGLQIAANQSRGLRPAEARHALDIGPQKPLGATLLQPVLMLEQQPLYPFVDLQAA